MDTLPCMIKFNYPHMLHTYYRHREGKTIRQYKHEDFIYEYNAYKAMKGNSFIKPIRPGQRLRED